jgi:diadenosine tetraphosphate (Ap4A) HIT family hydrolase
LLSGVPGAGKTLVGLQVAHARYLDELAIARKSGKETTPAVFLSGNGPLVEVLQYALKDAGGDGKTFVRGVKEYVRRYSKKPGLVPPEHLLVFDEAQRAFDAAMVAEKHKGDAGAAGKSEPEHFVEFAERIPEWCVVVGLIGSGQEIHVGEEAGIVQWRWAVENAGEPSKWTVHAPPRMSEIFEESTVAFTEQSSLNLDTELRFHATADLHRFVGGVLESPDDPALPMIADRLERNGFHLRVTRCVDTAKEYLRERYAEDPDARFGLLASSKDRDLIGFGVPNDFQSTKRLRMGPWYGDGEDVPGSRSCRLLDTCQTEFGAQGLELDATLLAWGTDFVVSSGCWLNANARGYQKKALVRDAHQLRLNAYRVLMTRGRDGCVIWVPPLEVLDQTFLCLKNAGCRELDARRGSCLFCSMPSDRIVIENDLSYAVYDKYPVTKQHFLIIPKRHVADYFGLSPEELLACDALLRQLRSQIEDEDSTVEGFNIGMNIGEVAGQTVFHCHIHLIPRRRGDVPDPRGGVRNLIPGKGNY